MIWLPSLESIVGPEWIRRDPEALLVYGTDALKKGHPADLVVIPANTREVAAVARQCHESGVPLVVRGAGTGYTGGAVPVRGGVVLSLERLNRILEIDEENLLAVVEPNVITGDLQQAVERVGLFYPPDPASLHQSVIGGNVAECAGGPRAFKYGTTKRYVLGLEAVLPSGRDHPHRIEGSQERRRLRPDAAAGGLGRDARHHHAGDPAARAEAARPDHAAGDVHGRRGRRARRDGAHSTARRARDARADRP